MMIDAEAAPTRFRRRRRERRQVDATNLSPCVNPRCERRDDDGNIEPVATVFCDSCRKRIRSDLVELTAHYVELHCRLQPVDAVRYDEGGKPTKAPEAPLPMNTEYVSLMDDLVREVTSLADRIRAVRYGRILKPSETPGRTARRGHSLSKAIDFLASNLHWTLEKHDDGEHSGLLILQLNHRCRSTLGHTRLVKTFNVPCPDCGSVAITQAAGTDLVQCRLCGAHWKAHVITALEHAVAYELGQAEGT